MRPYCFQGVATLKLIGHIPLKLLLVVLANRHIVITFEEDTPFGITRDIGQIDDIGAMYAHEAVGRQCAD